MSFKYQMHMHTLPCSACSKVSMEQMVQALHAGGYAGGVITNHFIGGNTGIDRSLSWHDFVKAYEDDWLLGKKLGKEYGVEIFFGLEEGIGGGKEILCYGITPKVLYDNPDLAKRDLRLWHEAAVKNSFLCVQAHPFRNRAYITQPGLAPVEFLDGIEVFNECNNEEENHLAHQALLEHPEFIAVAGADSHETRNVCFCGIETEQRLHSEHDLYNVLKSGKAALITR